LRIGALLLVNLAVFILADRLVSVYNKRKATTRRVVSQPRPVAVTLKETPTEVVEAGS